MRRPGNYGDSGGNAYGLGQMQQMSAQRMEYKSGHYQGQGQGQPDSITSEKEHPYRASKAEGQWRWQRDESKGSSPMSPHMYNEGQTGEASRPYFQGQRLDSKIVMEKQASNDPRSHPHEEDMDIGYEDKHMSQTFEGLEKRFLDDIMKLSEEQTDAEDAENVRHRERINAINGQYQEQLAALRARHAGRRDEFLRRESRARQQQYQQAVMDQYNPSSVVGPNDPQGYGGAAAAAGELHRTHTADQYDSYRERARFPGGARDFDHRGSYSGGRVYDTGARYY